MVKSHKTFITLKDNKDKEIDYATPHNNKDKPAELFQ